MRVFRFEEIDSTNRYLKEKEDKQDYDCVISKIQSAGVGRRGNTWVSKEGMALFSFAVNEKNIFKENQMKTSLMMGISLLHSLKKIENLDYMFKWTNDIYLEGKKLSGILIEKVGEWFIIGIGININNKDFGYASDRATSLINTTGKYYNIEDIVFTIINDFKKALEYNSWEYMLSEINKFNYLKDKEIEVVKENSCIGNGIARNIAYDGTLEVEIDGSIKNFNIGEIHIKR